MGFGLALGFCFGGFCGWVGAWGSGNCWSCHPLDSCSLWSGSALLVMGAWVDFGFPLVPRLTCVSFSVAGPRLGAIIYWAFSLRPLVGGVAFWAFHWGCFLPVVCGALWAVQIFFIFFIFIFIVVY